MLKKIILLVSLCFISCNFEKPTQFSEKALQDTLVSVDGTQLSVKEVINKYKGKKILIDVWASWCTDCLKSLPKVVELQQDFPEVVFLFLSVDKQKNAWKNAIKRFNIKGEHYNLPKGMKDGDFVDFLSVSWIPRYLVIDKTGAISLFKATKVTDTNIVDALKK